MYYGEKLNSITHLVGAVLSLMGLGSLLTISFQLGNAWTIFSYSVFGSTLVLLYVVSTLYHSVKAPKLKGILQRLDHVSIYLLICGTYTPYMLVSLREENGVLLLAVVWILALIGILFDTMRSRRIELLQLTIYLLMGWMVMLEFNSLVSAIGAEGAYWLLFGGLAYTFGLVFYCLDQRNKLQHAHGVWHLFVLTGSAAHFTSIIGHVR